LKEEKRELIKPKQQQNQQKPELKWQKTASLVKG
jgi:hypothetical protein